MTVMRDKVVKALVELDVKGDENGLMPGYNVLVNFLPTSFWTLFAERMINSAPAEKKEQVRTGLYQCAQECGYHTGWGIINSDEFQSVVMPMVTEGAKDVLRGAFAVFTAWGWAKSGVVQIKDGERMVIRAQDYYEQDIKIPNEKMAFMVSAVSGAFFDLAYGSEYPNGLGTFKCDQTKGIEVGDDFGEFIVSKK
ncbi:MAG: hypothetical protein CVU65_11145 [Deltaproteobacteria bacterium HGW-Deltaproteobacteria-22]|jgi:hypothetical protein|nr:MAG: hypothetical protein CVU65_11145 [Deltaproteobacteria bacterium HGW-Deltaproteobacteria-22]